MQWYSSHLGILDLSRGGISWPKTVHCRNYSELSKIFSHFFAVSLISVSQIQIVFLRNFVERIHLKHKTTAL